MKIETGSAQINVRDNQSSGGVNINQTLSGYAATMYFWGGAPYLCKRKDDPFVHIVVVPAEKWLQDIKDDGYEVISHLSDLAKGTATQLLIQRNQLRYYLATMMERKAHPFEAEEQAAILKLLEETKG